MDNNNETILKMTELVQQHHSRLEVGEKRIDILKELATRHQDSIDKLTELTRQIMDVLAPDEPDMDPVEADADALASAGYGTDEDYGGDVERL
tara:strand:+ start:63 stop:341 length:279 start_codon:yes stop_codon:yes gene_type:complete